MAITIEIQPPIGISPAENLAYWKLSSNQPNLVYFKVDVTIDGTANIAGSFKYYPRPDLLNGCIIEVSNLLQSLLRNPFQPMHLQDLNWSEQQVLSVQLLVTEMIFNSSTSSIVAAGGVTTIGRRFFWNGKLDPFEQSNLQDYFTNNNNKAKFLTSNKLQRITSEFEGRLNFLTYENNTQDLKIFLDEYDSINNIWTPAGDWDVQTYNNATANNIRERRYWNFNINYSHISSVLGNPFVKEFRVRLSKNNIDLDSIVFVLDEQICNEKQLPIFWENSYGGWDSTILFNPYFEYDIERTSMDVNSTKLNSLGNYAEYDLINSKVVFNKEKAISNVNTSSKIIANSMDLTDAENAWIKGLLTSKQVYVKYNESYFPCIIEEKKLSTLTKRKSGGVNIKTFSLSIMDY